MVGGIILLVLSAAALALVVYGPFRTAQDGEGEESSASTSLSVAVTPTYDWELLSRELEPVFAHLRRANGVAVDVSHPETVASAVEDVLEERTDVAILPALACAQVEEWGGRLLVIQEHGGSYSSEGLLVARASAEIESVRQARSICYVGPGSTMGHLAPRAWMRSHGINPDAHFAGGERWSVSHRAALVDLEEGRCDVAAVSDLALAMARVRGGLDGAAINELSRTARLPTPCWAVRRELPSNTRRALVESLELYTRRHVEEENLSRRFQITGYRQPSTTTFRAVRVGAGLAGLLHRQNNK